MKKEIDCRKCVHYDVCYKVVNREVKNPCKNGVECKHYMEIPAGTENVNRCVMCGAVIPEGRQICPKCEGEKYNGN